MHRVLSGKGLGFGHFEESYYFRYPNALDKDNLAHQHRRIFLFCLVGLLPLDYLKVGRHIVHAAWSYAARLAYSGCALLISTAVVATAIAVFVVVFVVVVVNFGTGTYHDRWPDPCEGSDAKAL